MSVKTIKTIVNTLFTTMGKTLLQDCNANVVGSIQPEDFAQWEVKTQLILMQQMISESILKKSQKRFNGD